MGNNRSGSGEMRQIPRNYFVISYAQNLILMVANDRGKMHSIPGYPKK